MALHPTNLWDQEQYVSVDDEATWAAICGFNFTNGVQYQLTAGNKVYALSNEPIWNDDGLDKKESEERKSRFISEAVLFRKYRQVFVLQKKYIKYIKT